MKHRALGQIKQQRSKKNINFKKFQDIDPNHPMLYPLQENKIVASKDSDQSEHIPGAFVDFILMWH